MPTGIFEADFSSFEAGAAQAVSTLKKLEKGAEGVEVAAKRMVSPTGGAGSGIAKFGQELGQVDRILNVFGVSVGNHIGALKEISTIAGTAGSSLGLVATGALGVGAAFAGWQAGRWIADMTGLDKATARWYTTMLGLPDVVEQTGKAQADVLRRYTELTGNVTHSYLAAVAAITEIEAKRRQFQEDHKKAVEEINGSLVNQRFVLHGINGEVIEGAKYLLQQGIEAKKVADYYGLTAGQIGAINRDLDTSNKLIKQQSEELKAVQAARVTAYQQQQAGAIGTTQRQLGDFGLPTQVAALKALDAQLQQNVATMLKGLDEEQRQQENLITDQFEYAAAVAKNEQERMRLLQDYGKLHLAIIEQIRQADRARMQELTALTLEAVNTRLAAEKDVLQRRGLVGEGAEKGQVQRTKSPQEDFDKRVKEITDQVQLFLEQTGNLVGAQKLYAALMQDAQDKFVIASGGFIQKFNETGAVVGVFGQAVKGATSELQIISGESDRSAPYVGVFGTTPASPLGPKPGPRPFSLPGFSLSGPSPGVNYSTTINVQGVWDSRSQAELAAALSNYWMSRGPQTPNR